MNQCVNDVVAFGLNQKELDIVVVVGAVITILWLGRWLLGYLNHGLEPRDGDLLPVDLEMEARRKRRGPRDV